MTQPPYRANDLPVAYLTITRHGGPKRAVWFGRDQGTPAVSGSACTIVPLVDGWQVAVDGGEPFFVGPHARVWLAPLPGQVLNPSPVPIRLNSTDLHTFTALGKFLREAARSADDAAVTAEDPIARVALRSVRDALRQAAVETLVPRGGTGTPRCSRCSHECGWCQPPDRCRNCGLKIAAIDAAAADGTTYYHVDTTLVGCGPDGVTADNALRATPGGSR